MSAASNALDPLIAQLVAAREAAGLEQWQVATAAGISQPTLKWLEQGQGTPTLERLRQWMQALGLEPAAVPLTYHPGFEDPTTAPAGHGTIAAGNGAAEGGLKSPPAVPASPPVSLGSDGDRRDVARTLDVAEQTVEKARELR